MLILNLWKCLFVKATTTLLTNTLNTIRCGAVIVTRPLKMHSLWYREYFAIKESEKGKMQALPTWRLVQCALNIEYKFYYMSRSLSSQAPNILIFHTLLSGFIPFHSFFVVVVVWFYFSYLYLLFYSRSLARSVCVCVCFVHAFHFMSYEIFIIPEIYTFFESVFYQM